MPARRKPEASRPTHIQGQAPGALIVIGRRRRRQLQLARGARHQRRRRGPHQRRALAILEHKLAHVWGALLAQPQPHAAAVDEQQRRGSRRGGCRVGLTGCGGRRRGGQRCCNTPELCQASLRGIHHQRPSLSRELYRHTVAPWRRPHRQHRQLSLLCCRLPERDRLAGAAGAGSAARRRTLALARLAARRACPPLQLLSRLVAGAGGAVLHSAVERCRLQQSHSRRGRRARHPCWRRGAAAVGQTQGQVGLQVCSQAGAALWRWVGVQGGPEATQVQHRGGLQQCRRARALQVCRVVAMQQQQRCGGQQRHAGALCRQHNSDRRRQRRRQAQLLLQAGSRGGRRLAKAARVDPQALKHCRGRGARRLRRRRAGRQLPADLPLGRGRRLFREQQQRLTASAAGANAGAADARSCSNAIHLHRLQRQRQVGSSLRLPAAELEGGA